MNKFVAFLATLAFCVTETLTNPTVSEADPFNFEYDTPLAIDCEWAEWGPCKDIKCGIGSQVFKIFPSLQSKSIFSHFYG